MSSSASAAWPSQVRKHDVRGVRATGPLVVPLALIVVLLLAGCGGKMQPSELQDSVGTLASAAAEGKLLARDVA